MSDRSSSGVSDTVSRFSFSTVASLRGITSVLLAMRLHSRRGVCTRSRIRSIADSLNGPPRLLNTSSAAGSFVVFAANALRIADEGGCPPLNGLRCDVRGVNELVVFFRNHCVLSDQVVANL